MEHLILSKPGGGVLTETNNSVGLCGTDTPSRHFEVPCFKQHGSSDRGPRCQFGERIASCTMLQNNVIDFGVALSHVHMFKSGKTCLSDGRDATLGRSHRKGPGSEWPACAQGFQVSATPASAPRSPAQALREGCQ